MATFRCKRSGNLVSFINEGDIQGLRKHEGYEEVFENEKAVVQEPAKILENDHPQTLTAKRKYTKHNYDVTPYRPVTVSTLPITEE